MRFSLVTFFATSLLTGVLLSYLTGVWVAEHPWSYPLPFVVFVSLGIGALVAFQRR